MAFTVVSFVYILFQKVKRHSAQIGYAGAEWLEARSPVYVTSVETSKLSSQMEIRSS